MQSEIPHPEKFLLIDTNTQFFGDNKYTYFFADKNNQRLFGRHQRFFILKENQKTHEKEFGYARELPKGTRVPFLNEEQIPSRKVSVHFDNLKETKLSGKQTMEISFTSNNTIITWELTFQTERMATNINNILENAKREPIQNVVHTDYVNETVTTLNPTPSTQKQNKQKNNAENKNLQTNPFTDPAQKPLNQLNKQTPPPGVVGALEGLVNQNQNTSPKQNNPTQNVRTLTFAGPQNNSQEPIKKINLINIAQQNEKQKDKFKKNMQNHQFKQQGYLDSKLSNLPLSLNHQKQSIGNLADDYRKVLTQLLSRRQQIINNDNQHWNYLFTKGNEQNLIEQFKRYSQNIVSELIDQFALPKNQRAYSSYLIQQQSMFEEYDIDNLRIRLCFTSMSEIRLLKNSKQSIYNEKELKNALRQFKNMDYLLSITRNKGKIRLPLANIVEYKGIIAFVRTKIDEEQRQATNLSNELKLISKQSRVRKDIFADPRSLKIKPLLSKSFEKFVRQEPHLKKSQRLFEYYYLDQTKHFLPVDLTFVQKDPDNNLIRPELLQNEELDGTQLMGFSVEPFLNRSKTDKNVQQAFRQLQAVSKSIQDAINDLLEEWQGLDVITLTSDQVQTLFHKHGVNMRYLGMVYDKANVGLIRKICMSEVCSRSAKIILRATLQDFIRSYADSLTPQQISKKDKITHISECNFHTIEIVLKFLNNITSQSSQSQQYWKVINKQSQYKFNISVSKLDVLEPYFIQSIVSSFNIDFNWEKLPQNKSLFKGKIFKRDMIKGFRLKSKNYNPNFTDLYVRINLLIDEGNEESIEQIKSILNLRKVDIPSHFKLNGVYEKLAFFISSYVEPKEENTQNYVLPCTSIYNLIHSVPPTYTSIILGITQIKWLLKSDKIDKALVLYKKMVERISQWCGDIHPMHTQLYSMFAQYYLLKGDFETAMNYSRSALANSTKILGVNHQKIAQRYFELGEIGFKSSRKQDSLSNYRKAKNICDSINEADNLHYAEICLKIAMLSLQFDKLEQAEAICRTAVEIFELNRGEQNPNNEQAEKFSIECYELLMRIYEVWGKVQEMQQISYYCGESLQDFISVTNLQKVLKVYLIPYITRIKRKQAQKMISLFSQIPLQPGTSSNNAAYNYIKMLIENEQLIQTVEHLFDNFNQVYDQITGNYILTRWRGFQVQGQSSAQQCISLVESLIYFLGEGFIIGGLGQK